MKEYYVVVCEYKNDDSLAHETYLNYADYETAYNRMKQLEAAPRVIRVAIGKLVYETGNKNIFK